MESNQKAREIMTPEEVEKTRKQLEDSLWKQFEGVKVFHKILLACAFIGVVMGSWYTVSQLLGTKNANRQQKSSTIQSESPTIKPAAESGTPGRIRTRIQR